MCCYREAKNFDRFVRLTQSIVFCTLHQLRAIRQKRKTLEDGETSKKEVEEAGKEKAQDQVEKSEKCEKSKREDTGNYEKSKKDDGGAHCLEDKSKSVWSQQDREKLFHLLSKIFLLNFPLYIAMKHGGALNPLAPVKVQK